MCRNIYHTLCIPWILLCYVGTIWIWIHKAAGPYSIFNKIFYSKMGSDIEQLTNNFCSKHNRFRRLAKLALRLGFKKYSSFICSNFGTTSYSSWLFGVSRSNLNQTNLTIEKAIRQEAMQCIKKITVLCKNVRKVLKKLLNNHALPIFLF